MPRYSVDEIRTWVMDIRQVLSDNSIKDVLEDMGGHSLLVIHAGGPESKSPEQRSMGERNQGNEGSTRTETRRKATRHTREK